MKTVLPDQIDSETPILDIRKHRHGEQIRGAVYYNPDALLDADKLVLPLPHEGSIALCADNEKTAEAVAERLADNGFEDVELIKDGFDGWKAAGLPTEEATQEQPVPDVDGSGLKRF